MRSWKYIFSLLFSLLAVFILAIWQLPDTRLHIISCDVGQGDATLLIHRNLQILVDGGPNDNVLDCLGKHLPFWDRTIELVILTHPDRDHFLGLVEVFRRYKVDNYLYNPITISKPEYKLLEKEVGRRVVKGLYPHEGQVIRLGMIQLDTLAPLVKIVGHKKEGER